ncbi:hypothetical protein RhiirA5_500890 [Rhizophagus irregularis]|uniref:Uncharacterized protein n=1 Tax=Rhizophagus irregularis TaxID=588596 RepID=A0A2N0PJU1_9GLOM|nr:hypothetical protein RhiirA5_500890 [Rhizophagus irregularis]PKC63713.1 hypothetical protein RhiirA1_537570 [Rhizophagus irregularis]
MQNTEILEKFEDMKKNMADGSLTNGLVIQDLENRIRNLEANVTAKKRIILEKNSETQKKKKCLNKKRKRARPQHAKNGMITEPAIDMIDYKDKDRLEKYFADKSRDITFYDVPAYWSDDEILALINENVGSVEYMRSK